MITDDDDAIAVVYADPLGGIRTVRRAARPVLSVDGPVLSVDGQRNRKLT